MVKQRTGDVLRSADRLLRVLEWYAPERPAGSAAEIARDLDIAPATVRRLLGLLESHRYLQRDPVLGSYWVGFAPVRLAAIARGSNPVMREAQDELDRLQRDFGELIIYGILDGIDVVHIDNRDSTYPLRVHRSVGRRVRADAGGAIGTVLLAWRSSQELELLLGSTTDRDDHTNKVVAGFAAVRRRGYAINPGRAFDGNVWAVATPVRDSTGVPVAAIGLVAPASRAGKPRQRELIGGALTSAAVISERLGWAGSSSTI